jgi:hypothetical protein
MPDAEFRSELIALFVDAGKPAPSPGQVREVAQALPDHALARQAFLRDVRKSIGRIRTPGVLPGHTRTFVEAWPCILERLEITRAEEWRTAERRPDPANQAEVYRSTLADSTASAEDKAFCREMLGITEVA